MTPSYSTANVLCLQVKKIGFPPNCQPLSLHHEVWELSWVLSFSHFTTTSLQVRFCPQRRLCHLPSYSALCEASTIPQPSSPPNSFCSPEFCSEFGVLHCQMGTWEKAHIFLTGMAQVPLHHLSSPSPHVPTSPSPPRYLELDSRAARTDARACFQCLWDTISEQDTLISSFCLQPEGKLPYILWGRRSSKGAWVPFYSTGESKGSSEPSLLHTIIRKTGLVSDRPQLSLRLTERFTAPWLKLRTSGSRALLCSPQWDSHCITHFSIYEML